MTLTDTQVPTEATEDEDTTTGTDENETPQDGETAEETAKRGRDFSKVRPYHEQLAAFVNERSGLDPVTANQIKAVLALRTDYGNTDEAKQAREARHAELEAAKLKYAGLTPDQVKAKKAAERAQEQAERMQKKAAEAVAKAQQLAAAASGSGEDLQSVVQASQTQPETQTDSDESEEAPKTRRGLGRRR